MASYFWMKHDNVLRHRLSGAINAPAKNAAKSQSSRHPRLIELTANPALTGFTLPKIWWVRRHEPQIWARVRSILPAQGLRAVSPDRCARDRCRRCFRDADARCRQPPLVPADPQDFSVGRATASESYESPEITWADFRRGCSRHRTFALAFPSLRAPAIRRLVRVGMGIVKAGAVSATIGTSGVVFGQRAKPVLEPGGRIHTFCHAIPGRWHVMGVTQGAGLSLRWFRDQFWRWQKTDGRDPTTASWMKRPKTSPGAEGLLWRLI